MKRAFILLLVLVFSLSSVQGEATLDGKQYEVTYSILEANSGNVTWFSPDYSKSYNYTFEDVKDIVISFDSLQLNTSISILIGGFKVSDYPDSALDGNLALGYWEFGYDFGFISDTNWNELNTSKYPAKTITGLNITTEKTTVIQDGENITVGATSINITSQFQNTLLKYDSTTGVLLEAKTGFGAYYLHIKAKSAVGDVYAGTKYLGLTNEETAPVSIFVLLALPVLSLIYRRKLAS